MDTRFQPSRTGPPRNEAALEEIRRLFERYRARPLAPPPSHHDRHEPSVPPHHAGAGENPVDP
jgi:hypothetical protein